jgi:MFS family permease
MLERIRNTTKGYPRQFWLIFWSMFINASGGSMVWPFLTIYMRQQLDVPLTSVTLLLTANSVAGLLATSFVGPAVDRFGRKSAMILGLAVNGAAFVFMIWADSMPVWLVLMIINGTFSPLIRVSINAMVADLIEVDRRADAYALTRMIQNFGVAIGPAVGGFISSASYTLAFIIAAVARLIVVTLLVIFARETLPKDQSSTEMRSMGYGPVLRDGPFMAICVMLVLAGMAYSLVMILLPVYAKENFGVPESQYGFIMATNAAMVVFFQYGVTKITSRFHHLQILAAGAMFYALGAGSVALGSSFSAFLMSMVVLTIGELMVMPTATTLTANLAPADMRGRYMGVYSLTWGAAFGIGPVIAGILNDNIAPVAMWYGGLVMGLLAVVGFLVLTRVLPKTSSSHAEA